jgi:hypothetical protein
MDIHHYCTDDFYYHAWGDTVTRKVKKNAKNRENKLVYKIKTPDGLMVARDIEKNMGEMFDNEEIVVIDFGTGKKLGTFKLNMIKLKFF